MDSQFDSYELGPLVFDAVRLHAALAAVAIALLLWLFFTRTRTGKSIRAAADNHMGALVVGLDVRRLYAITFGVGAACVGAACLIAAAGPRDSPSRRHTFGTKSARKSASFFGSVAVRGRRGTTPPNQGGGCPGPATD
jgi:branched-subunit amino acid ABC-type transport system permease component